MWFRRVVFLTLSLCFVMLAMRGVELVGDIQVLSSRVAVAEDEKPEFEPLKDELLAQQGATEEVEEEVVAPEEIDDIDLENSQDMSNPLLFSQSEIELLQQLADRRAELQDREENLVKKEGLLQVAEQRVNEKIQQLNTMKQEMVSLKAEINETLKSLSNEEEKEIDRLVKTYEKMKPKDAARIFDQLEMDILLQVVKKMKESKTAPVLANMDTTKAKELTSLLASKKDLPDLEGIVESEDSSEM